MIILGKDHSYVAKGVPGSKNEIAEKSNHFIKNYYTKGNKFDTPDYHGEEFAYRLAKDKFENTGRSITDCSVNGKLFCKYLNLVCSYHRFPFFQGNISRIFWRGITLYNNTNHSTIFITACKWHIYFN